MNSPKPAPKKYSTLHIFLICLLAIVLIGGGWLFYRYEQNNKAIAKERAQYAQAEKDMDALATQITAKFGQPDDSKKVKSCGFASSFSEVGHGDLYCSFSVDIVYPVLNRESATQLSESISSYIKSSSLFAYGNSSSALANISITPVELKSESMRDRNGLKCSTSYTYSLASDSTVAYSGLRSKSSQSLTLTSSCGSRPAKAAYFPIAQD